MGKVFKKTRKVAVRQKCQFLLPEKSKPVEQKPKITDIFCEKRPHLLTRKILAKDLSLSDTLKTFNYLRRSAYIYTIILLNCVPK